jgi:hypothetical protein
VLIKVIDELLWPSSGIFGVDNAVPDERRSKAVDTE